MPLYHIRRPLIAAALPAVRQPGPVTLAIRAARRNELPSWALREQQLEDERRALHDLRDRISRRVEADLSLLDELDGDPDLEHGDDDELGGDMEPWLGSIDNTAHGLMSQQQWAHGSADDSEMGDDNGLADVDGQQEQHKRFLALGGSLDVVWGAGS